MKFKLPLSPTINDYWRPTTAKHTNAKRPRVYMYLTAVGKQYKTAVIKRIGKHCPTNKRLKLTAVIHFNDKRKSDLDNRLKGLLDALEYAGVYEDDSQIDELHIYRGDVVKGGMIEVEVSEL